MPPSRKPSLEKKTTAAAMEGFGVSLDDVSETWQRSIREFAEIQGVEHDPEAVSKSIVDGLRQFGL